MFWWTKARNLPPLIAGGDGLPPSPILFGGNAVGDDLQSAGRATLGYWLDSCQESAVVVRVYGTEGADDGISLQSDGNPAFAIPFINDASLPAFAGLPDSLVLADAGILIPGLPATARASASNEVYGGDAFLRRQYYQCCDYRIDWLAGYQYAGIDDDVFLQTSTSLAGANSTFATSDAFEAENRFHAGQFGVMLEVDKGLYRIQLMGKVGLGNMNQRMSIRGSNTVNGVVTGGGIFAQDQSAAGGPNFNIGQYERDEFAVSPELNLKTIWCLRDQLNLTIGYSVIYWSDVLLAGDQVDTNINRDVLFDGPFIPGGGNGPAFRFNGGDLVAQSIDIGLLWQY